LRTVVVGKLAGRNIRQQDLEQAFSVVGTVESCVRRHDHATITFADPRAAKKAVAKFDGGELGDRVIDVYFQRGGDSGQHGARAVRR